MCHIIIPEAGREGEGSLIVSSLSSLFIVIHLLLTELTNRSHGKRKTFQTG